MANACEIDQSKLEAFVDGELNQAEQSQVEQHLSSCPECEIRIESMRFAAGILRAQIQQAADEADFTNFEARVMAGIEEDQPRGLLAWLVDSFRHNKVAWVASAAAAALLLTVLIPMLSQTPKTPALTDPRPDSPRMARVDQENHVDNEVIIDSMEYNGQRSMIFTVSKNNTTVIWMTDFDRSGEQDTQGDEI